MGVFTVFTDYLENEEIEKWCQNPSLSYPETVCKFIDDVHQFGGEHPELALKQYMNILEANGIVCSVKGMKTADVSSADEKLVMALIVGAIRADYYSMGALLDIFKSGAMNRWLLRLKEIESCNQK